MNEIDRTKLNNDLYDFYSCLLTEYQQEIFELYYQDNLSLKEIAELKNVSRNAVYLIIKRVEKMLNSYEENLHLLEKYNKINKLKIDSDTKNKILEILEG